MQCPGAFLLLDVSGPSPLHKPKVEPTPTPDVFHSILRPWGISPTPYTLSVEVSGHLILRLAREVAPDSLDELQTLVRRTLGPVGPLHHEATGEAVMPNLTWGRWGDDPD